MGLVMEELRGDRVFAGLVAASVVFWTLAVVGLAWLVSLASGLFL